MLGTVKFFDERHGFGFITTLGTDVDIFVHFSQIRGKGRRVLQPGQEVSFRLVHGEKGPTAEGVTVIDDIA
jgi:CspA family cold shock protein